MKRSNPFVHAGLGLAAALTLGACATIPTLESIKYGYSSPRAVAVQEEPIPDDYNDMAAGWAPQTRPEEQRPTEYGFDGSPVGASVPGQVTEMKRPINDGVDQAPQGTRNLLLDLYAENQKEVERLTTANEDLSIALELAETRAADFEQQLKDLQVQFDRLGADKQAADQKSFDLAARLATAQIARLEAERALLEGMIEWRRRSAVNNRPLDEGGEKP
ncbi:MAG: hypothetical protein VX015_09030 [Planctomycetota bacterium]|nr:hypothetical protein [Planctomycetota bacterium]MEC8512275.1 hypothetical protein [Planctomycetota bacterium]